MLISGFHCRNLHFTEVPPSESDARPGSGITGLDYARQKSKETSRFLLKNASHSPYSLCEKTTWKYAIIKLKIASLGEKKNDSHF